MTRCVAARESRVILERPRAPGFMVAAFQPTDSFHEVHMVEAIQRAARSGLERNRARTRVLGVGAARGAPACAQLLQVANMPMAAVAITAQASQPRVVSHGVSVNWSIT